MTELERELLATIERMNGSQMLQATTELTTAVNKLTYALATFAEAFIAMSEANREVAQQARERFRLIRQDMDRGMPK
jgi:hypothetical protein